MCSSRSVGVRGRCDTEVRLSPSSRCVVLCLCSLQTAGTSFQQEDTTIQHLRKLDVETADKEKESAGECVNKLMEEESETKKHKAFIL